MQKKPLLYQPWFPPPAIFSHVDLCLVFWQVVAYTILDIISKVVFSFMIVSAHDSLGSSSAPAVQSREYV